MNLSDLKAVIEKEFREIMRNWHALGILLTVCALYPATLLILSITLKGGTETSAKPLNVAVHGNSNYVENAFAKNQIQIIQLDEKEARERLDARKLDAIVTVPEIPEQSITGSGSEPSKALEAKASSDPSAQTEPLQLNGLTTAPDDPNTPTVLIQTNSTQAGRQAASRLEEILDRLHEEKLRARLLTLNSEMPWFSDVKEKSIEVGAPKVGKFVAVSLPFLMTVIILAMCAASSVESVNGEKTRKTWQVLLSTALDRNSLLYGKLISSVACAFIGIVVCLTSMLVCSAIARTAGLEQGANFQLPEAIVTAGLAVPLAISLSSLFVLLCLCARNTQEAGLFTSAATVLCALLPSMAAMPLKYAAPALYLVPVVNVSLCISESLQSGLNYAHFATAVASSCAVAAACLYGCAKVLNNESIMFGVSTPIEYRKDHSGTILLLCSIVFLLFIYLGQYITSKDIFWGTIISQTMLLALPAWCAVKWSRLPIKETMRFNRATAKQLIGACLLAPGVTLAAIAVASLQNSFLPVPVEYDQMMKTMILKGRPMWQTIIAMAITPGACEEILFRGAILGMLCRNMKPLSACLLTGLLFGLFHMSSFRFLPTGVAGIILSAVAISTGSIFPGMLLHATHNCCAIALALNEDNVQLWHLAAALVSTASGAYLIWGLQKPEIVTKS